MTVFAPRLRLPLRQYTWRWLFCATALCLAFTTPTAVAETPDTVTGAAPISGMDNLLQRLKQRQKEESALNQQREAAWLTARNQMKAKLDKAEQDFLQAQETGNPLKKTTDANAEKIIALQKELSRTADDLADVQAISGHFAGKFADMLDQSLIAAREPDRTGRLQTLVTRLGNNKEAGASPDAISQLQTLLQDEIDKSADIVSFEADVTDSQGHNHKQTVFLAGPFTAYSADHFLRYIPGDTGVAGKLVADKNIAAEAGSAQAFFSSWFSAPGTTVSMIIDPSRGRLDDAPATTVAPVTTNISDSRRIQAMVAALLVFAISLTLLQRYTSRFTRYSLPMACALSLAITFVFFSCMNYLMHRQTDWKKMLQNAIVVQLDVSKYKQKQTEPPKEQPRETPRPPMQPDLKPPAPLALPLPKLNIPAPADIAMPDIAIPPMTTSGSSFISTSALGKGIGGGWAPPAPEKALAAGTTTGKKDAGFRPVIPSATRQPNVPQIAWDNRIDGWVLVTFTVNNNGTVSNIRILDASPRGVFEDNVIAAVEGWRYDSFQGAPMQLTQKIELFWKDYPRNNKQLK